MATADEAHKSRLYSANLAMRVMFLQRASFECYRSCNEFVAADWLIYTPGYIVAVVEGLLS